MSLTKDQAFKLIETYQWRQQLYDKKMAIHKASQGREQLISMRGMVVDVPFEISVTVGTILDEFDAQLARMDKEIVERGGVA